MDYRMIRLRMVRPLLPIRIVAPAFTSMSQLSGRVGLEQPLNYHKMIYTAILAHDADVARNLMREFVLDARSLLTRENARSKKAA
jgi:DNA-binding GntR family transcriptional regulator